MKNSFKKSYIINSLLALSYILLNGCAFFEGTSSQKKSSSQLLQNSKGENQSSVTTFDLKSAHAPATYHWTILSPDGFVSKTVEYGANKVSSDASAAVLKTTTTFKKIDLKAPSRIIVVGDTGCRLNETKYGAAYQNCGDAKEWPLKTVLASAVEEKPDLMVHLGDYHYREKCSNSEFCKNFQDSVGYNALAWEQDWFIPAREVPFSTPWLFVRGNHEDCHRAFEGYFSWISTEKQTLNLKEKEKEKCEEIEPTKYYVFKSESGEKMLWIQFDSSALADREDLDSSQIVDQWLPKFREMKNKIDEIQPQFVWFFTHRPAFGYALFNKKIVPTSPVLEMALRKSEVLKKIHVLFAGHVHASEVIALPGNPIQIVEGNGGSSLDLIDIPRASQTQSDEIKWSATTKKTDFGYLSLTRRSSMNSWQMDFKNSTGKLVQRCSLELKAMSKIASEAHSRIICTN
ncbi:MAG: metallophosphoesterase [Pseudobdellovibrionaceae bacterium]